jgi:hypothetical protein
LFDWLFSRDLEVDCEAHIGDPWNSWIRLHYGITDYWTDEELEIDDKIFLAASQLPFGGLRWWFVCPYFCRRAQSCNAARPYDQFLAPSSR